MKTKMKKLISISTIPVLALALLLVLGTVLSDGAAAKAKKPAPTLTGTTEYDFVGYLGIVVDGRTLVWEGTISGEDIDGVIQWWIPLPTRSTGSASHYDDLCVILDGDENVLLEVHESGSTTYRHPMDLNPIWRTNGVVTYAGPGFEGWLGCQTHADGDADLQELPPCGTGTFRVN